jgi:hypothetical protein
MAASLAVQKAVVAALAGVPGLTGVYDGPQPDAVAPYAVIGPDVVGDFSHKSGIAHEVRMVATIWDDRPGAARLRGLLGEAVTRLRALNGVWDGQRIVLARLQRAGVGAADDGWRPGSIELRVICEQI